MAPIRQGDGTGLAPKAIAEVRTGAGDVVYSTGGTAIPDSGISRLTLDDADTDTSTSPIKAIDSWSNNNADVTATTGDPSITDYDSGESYLLDGTDDVLDFGDPDELDFGSNDDFTITVWIKQTELTGDLLYKQLQASPYNGYWISNDGSNFNFTIRDSGGNQYSVSLNNSYASGNAHLLAVKREGSTIYIDIDAGTETQSASATSGDLSNSESLVVGNQTGSDYWTGTIDDIRWYNKALSSTELSNLESTGSI